MYVNLVQRLTKAQAIFAVSYTGSWLTDDKFILLHFVRPTGILGADIRKGDIYNKLGRSLYEGQSTSTPLIKITTFSDSDIM